MAAARRGRREEVGGTPVEVSAGRSEGPRGVEGFPAESPGVRPPARSSCRASGPGGLLCHRQRQRLARRWTAGAPDKAPGSRQGLPAGLSSVLPLEDERNRYAEVGTCSNVSVLIERYFSC